MRADTIVRRGVARCVCGRRIGEPGHQRIYCITHLRNDPSPGRGFPVAWDIPMRLYDQREGWYISKELERYLDFWLGSYRRALEALERRNPDWHRTYLATMHEDREPTELAREWSRAPGTVRWWKHEALAFMRRRDWDSIPYLPLDPTHDPSPSARAAVTEELKRINAVPEATA